MTLSIDDLAGLNDAEVGQVREVLFQLLSERYPAAELRRGVVHDLIMQLAGTVVAAQQANVDRVRRSQSLLAVRADPSLSTDAVVDALLSNFGVARLPGAAAAGIVTVVLDAAVPVVVPSGVTFTGGGATFVSAVARAVRTSAAAVTGPTDLVLQDLGAGRRGFGVPVVAAVVGAAGMARRGAAMAPAFSPPHFVQAYAEGDFVGGHDVETNAELMDRLRVGIAAKAWSNRDTIDAMLHAEPRFARCLQSSICGFGDPEQLRNHTLFPISPAGRCDAWIRPAALPTSVAVPVVATLVGTQAAGGVWQFDLGRDAAPGFYEVSRVALPSSPQSDAGFEVLADVRGLDATGPGWMPDVVTPVEAAYTRYQTATVRFLDPSTPVAGLVVGAAQAAYAVALSAMPLVADLQGYLGGRGVRDPGGDVLVRAPVPCFLTVSATVMLRPGSAAPTAATLTAARVAVAAAANSLGFAGALYASTLVAALTPYLPAGAGLGPIDMRGRIRRPDGGTTYLGDPRRNSLQVPSDPAGLVTARTVVFILDPADVAIGVETPDLPPI